MAAIHPTQTNSISRFQRVENLTILCGKALLGTACMLFGIALMLTLFLMLFGVPLTLVGVALVMSSGEGS